MALPIKTAIGLLLGREGAVQDAVVQGFEIIVDENKAKEAEERQQKRLKSLRADSEKTLAAVKAGEAQLASLGARLNASLNIFRQAGIVVGAEGLRVGQVRVGNAGIGVSEKTLIGAGALGLAAALGQVTGKILTTVADVADQVRQGKSLATVGISAAVELLNKTFFQVFDAFGGTNLTVGTAAILGGTSEAVARKAFNQMIEEATTVSFEGRRKLFQERALQRVQQDLNFLRNSASYYRQGRQKLIEEFPQDDRTQINGLADAFSRGEIDRQSVARDIFNRPLWKVVDVSANEGQP